MPRISRNTSDSNFFHTMVQGIEKQIIFDNPANMNLYIDLIQKNAIRADVIILAYCIMPNHAHILIYASHINKLTKFFSYTNTSYAMHFNSENKRVGYVFRDRYKSKSIYTIKQLINTINYIHDNPVKAGLSLTVDKYKYSSYLEYKGKAKIINKKLLYRYFGKENFIKIFK